MRRDYSNDSRATLAGGRHGMIYGALAGALVFAIASLALGLLDVNIGGPGISVMAGMAFGGLAGMMVGALRARHGGYHGPERRLRLATFDGRDRRVH